MYVAYILNVMNNINDDTQMSNYWVGTVFKLPVLVDGFLWLEEEKQLLV